MLDQKDSLPMASGEVLGDLAALAEQLGGTDGLCQLPIAALAHGTGHIKSVADLSKFLAEYTTRVLIPWDLPTVAQAYRHAVQYEVRELVALDRGINQLMLTPFLEKASRGVGRHQLLRLRPLRGERTLQRYLKAVEEGQANAWHTIVFGLVLALYSLPLRQGLVHFAYQTLGGFVRASSGRILISDTASRELLAVHAPQIVSATEALLAKVAGQPPTVG